MSYFFPEGGKFYYSTTFAAAKTITALTNASPAVASSTAHGYSDGDEVLIASGWDDVNDSVYKVDQLTADTFSLVDLDTTNTDFFPVGTGTGTAKKISSWVEVPQILTISTSGGEPNFAEVRPLARRNSLKVPIGFNAESITMEIGLDPTNATYKAMLALGRVSTKCAFKQVVPGGLTTYGYGYMITGQRGKMQAGNAITASVALTMLGTSMSYGT